MIGATRPKLPLDCLNLIFLAADKNSLTVVARASHECWDLALDILYRKLDDLWPLLQFLEINEGDGRGAPLEIPHHGTWHRFIPIAHRVQELSYTEGQGRLPPQYIIKISEWMRGCRALLVLARGTSIRWSHRRGSDFLPNLRSFNVDCTSVETLLALLHWLPQESRPNPHHIDHLLSLSIKLDCDSAVSCSKMRTVTQYPICGCSIRKLSIPVDLLPSSGSPVLTGLTILPAISRPRYLLYLPDILGCIRRSPNLRRVAFPFDFVSDELLHSLSSLGGLEELILSPDANPTPRLYQRALAPCCFDSLRHLSVTALLADFADITRATTLENVVIVAPLLRVLDITITDRGGHLDFNTLRPLLACNALEHFIVRHPFPVTITDENLLQMLQSWPNATCISLNPSPASRRRTTLLPTLRCLTYLVGRFKLESFGLYLNPNAKYAPKDYGISGSREELEMDFELDLGKSNTDGLCWNERQTAFFIGNLFPRRRMRFLTEGNSDWVKGVARAFEVNRWASVDTSATRQNRLRERSYPTIRMLG